MEFLSQHKMSVFWILVSVLHSFLIIQNSEAHPSVASKSLKTKQNQPHLQSKNDQYIEDKYNKQYSPDYSYHEKDEPQSGRLFLFDDLFIFYYSYNLA